MNHSVNFFDTQFARQIAGGEFALNPFERLALPYLHGRVLDLGCGLGNLAIEAARRGCSVLALDASANAIEHIRETAGAERLRVEAQLADLASYRITDDFDAIVSIGLLMFMQSSPAHRLLDDIQSHVNSGGCAIINVLIQGTTYLDMFERGNCYLFGEDELSQRFAGWEILESRRDSFDAPGKTIKRFSTVAARKAVPPLIRG